MKNSAFKVKCFTMLTKSKENTKNITKLELKDMLVINTDKVIYL